MTTVNIIIPQNALLTIVLASAGIIAIVLLARFAWKSLLP